MNPSGAFSEYNNTYNTKNKIKSNSYSNTQENERKH